MSQSVKAIKSVVGRGIPVPGNDIDTDQIIPGRFLKCVTFDELAAGLFYDCRFDEEGRSLNHPLDDAKYNGGSILISGDNFGCGSSREHAPQALQKSGITAVVAGSFAEIFFGNSTTLGIPCVSMADKHREALMELVKHDPQVELVVDLESLVVKASRQEWPIQYKESARAVMVEGAYDPLDVLLSRKDLVAKKAASLPHRWDL